MMNPILGQGGPKPSQSQPNAKSAPLSSPLRGGRSTYQPKSAPFEVGDITGGRGAFHPGGIALAMRAMTCRTRQQHPK